MAYTKEDIILLVREEEIEFIRMQFTDIFGQLKNVAITASQIERAVNNEIMLDGSSIEGFVRINESDQYLYPDLDSFVIFPWRPQHGKVARLICDIHNPDGSAFVGDPRGVLERVLEKARAMGYDTFNVGPEAEFFLFQTDEEGKPTTKTNDEAGYFDLGPLDHGESTRREICLALEQMGYEVQILEFIDMEHTPKNLLIRAVKKKKAEASLNHQNGAKRGIRQEHYNQLCDALNSHGTLEQLLEPLKNKRRI